MTTIDVQGLYTVHSSQSLSFTDEIAFQFVASGTSEPSRLVNAGEISASFSTAYTAVMGKAEGGPAVFWNKAGAVLSVAGGLSESDSTNGFIIGAADSVVRNDGSINVTSEQHAVGGWLGNSRMVNNGELTVEAETGTARALVIWGTTPEIVNHGTIFASGVNGAGLFLLSRAHVVNSGQIIVEGTDTAYGMLCASGVSDVRNSGVIHAVDLDGGDSVGIAFVGGGESCRLVNSGLISADIAFRAPDPTSTQVELVNSGQMIGKVLFAGDADVLRNTGAIDGDIDMGQGADLYLGQHAQADAVVYGAGHADSLYGGAGDDQLYGDRTTDTGFDGADLLRGGHGRDNLHGGGGNDTLVGGAGADELTGDGGSDVFVFAKLPDSAWSAPDLITDLEASDVIDLAGIDGDTAQAGDQAFHLVTALSGQAGEAALGYDQGSHMTRLELDVDGDGHADAVIAIDGDQTGFASFVL